MNIFPASHSGGVDLGRAGKISLKWQFVIHSYMTTLVFPSTRCAGVVGLHGIYLLVTSTLGQRSTLKRTLRDFRGKIVSACVHDYRSSVLVFITRLQPALLDFTPAFQVPTKASFAVDSTTKSNSRSSGHISTTTASFRKPYEGGYRGAPFRGVPGIPQPSHVLHRLIFLRSPGFPGKKWIRSRCGAFSSCRLWHAQLVLPPCLSKPGASFSCHRWQ
ncbi:hypothetical protein RvY_00329-2 [Ramazzottius varieornatus]|uniref:Uncharacterized protein n=1 Tax=Ramazzottius varieornatus TaxID=947166 RepID=A0A1D1UCV7_RAMVA|nr:hypothetical protein RvY_00329-2 [Ramazzottius varieornatus]